MGRAKKEVDTSLYSLRCAVRLRELREAAKLSVEELAAKVTRAGYELTVVTLYRWENGLRQIALDAVPALAKALKLPARELFADR